MLRKDRNNTINRSPLMFSNKSYWDFDRIVLHCCIALIFVLVILTPIFSYLIRYFTYSIVVLSCKSSGNETMDAISSLYAEVILLCYLIVLLVMDILLNIERHFTTHYSFNEDLFSEEDSSNLHTDELPINSYNYLPIRYSPKTEAYLDIAFLLFPTIIIFYIVIPTLGFLYNKEVNVDSSLSAFTIDVVGHQWYWSYGYNFDLFNKNFFFFLDTTPTKLMFDSLVELEVKENRLLSVDKMMVIPSNTVVTLCLTSVDVLHSWAVPQLGIKVDTIPGRITTCNLFTYAVGTFYGQCSELCGANHGFMPIVIESIPLDSFQEWLVEATCESHNFHFSGLLNTIYN